MLANVRKLLALAAREPLLGPLEYADRIRDIQDLRHKEGDAPAEADNADMVTLMTIHKAKGLEFEVVIVPQTDRPLGVKGKDLIIEPRLGLVAAKFSQAPSLIYRFLLERKREREESEELRVLYVALTRAKQRLCVCLYPKGGPSTLSKVIQAHIGATPPGVVERSIADEASNPLE